MAMNKFLFIFCLSTFLYCKYILIFYNMDDLVVHKRKRRNLMDGGMCDLSQLIPSGRRRKRNIYQCLSTSILKCLFHVDDYHFVDNSTHIIGNITVNLKYIGQKSNLTFNVSKMHVPLLHSDKITEPNYLKSRNNTWPWCAPNVPGKQLEISWNDSFIPFQWLNSTTIYVSAFGFEFLDGDNITKLLLNER
ncbi:protein EE16 [Proboscivirus elephantidbeta5]|uniref:Protein EE16 n=1 Tax=Elephant endotheliotropic herpesvirus 5 TaxID=768738 RepID=A0A075CYC5_9BETA|nr:protein EE16 [Elephant endotheliotropic herpesvirus 5]AHC02790.1 protein EE16 [Elephant endotheliotropic herpesvirus 5]